MSTVPDLATMQLLLRQGRWPACLSLGLLLVALLLLGIETGLAMIAAGLLLLSVAAGIAQATTRGVWGWMPTCCSCCAMRACTTSRRAAPISCCTTVACAVPRPLHNCAAGCALGRHAPPLPRQYLLTAVQFALLLIAVLWPQT